MPKVRDLGKQLAIYGAGDVAVSAVNLLLLPIYVRYLSEHDYGVLGLLGAVEVVAKIFFRWGLDGSFMRLFYEHDDVRGRQRLASTIFLFLLGLNGVLLTVSLGASPWLARVIFNDPAATRALQLVLLNTFAIGFTFIPFHVLRMEQRSTEFSLLTILRSLATVVLRLALVVGAGLGLMGVVVADVVVTAALLVVLARRFVPLIRPMFSRDVLTQSLAFGLPRVPHAAAQQIIAVGDKFILAAFRPIAEVGMYSMGVSFGLTQKLFLSAFEYAWAPFYYAAARERGAAALFATVTTYGVAALALLTAGLSAIARDLLDLMTRGVFVEAAPVVGWTAVGVFLQGVYLLTSIGLNISKRTVYYPASTIAAAIANIGLNYVAHPPVRHDWRRMGQRGCICAASGPGVHLLSTCLSRALRIRPTGACRRRGSSRIPGGQRPANDAGPRRPDPPGLGGDRRVHRDPRPFALLQTRRTAGPRSPATDTRRHHQPGQHNGVGRRDSGRRSSGARHPVGPARPSRSAMTRIAALVERHTAGVIAAIAVVFAAAYASSLVVRPKPDGRIVVGDALHHYVQLRSLVFDRDLHFQNEYVRMYRLKGGEPGTEWVYESTPTGYVRNLMPVGPGLLWAPAFLADDVRRLGGANRRLELPARRIRATVPGSRRSHRRRRGCRRRLVLVPGFGGARRPTRRRVGVDRAVAVVERGVLLRDLADLLPRCIAADDEPFLVGVRARTRTGFTGPVCGAGGARGHRRAHAVAGRDHHGGAGDRTDLAPNPRAASRPTRGARG